MNYLKGGYNADMKYLSTNEGLLKRESPYIIAPWTRSILTFNFLYKMDELTFNKNGPRFAMYSMLEDYHNSIYRYIKKFLIENSLFRESYKIYVDTGPIWEREIGRLSGLGWIGKNSMLISRRFGSFTFLAEALIDIRLDIDFRIQHDSCGTCDLCIRACPVNAIDTNRMIDSNKCISYHTIESRKIIPFEIASRMNNWVFGCDICNEICPWNRSSKGPTLFGPMRNFNVKFTLEDLLFMDKENFYIYFRNTPIVRAKMEGMRRNAVIAHFNVNNDDKILKEIAREYNDLGGKQAQQILDKK